METVMELTDSFYYFKTESENLISDDELIVLMKDYFDNICGGSLDYLNGTSLEELSRRRRGGRQTI
jgi:hypothetical protein